MYIVWLGKVQVQCDRVDEALKLCELWRKRQNQKTDAAWSNPMHQPVFVE